MKNHANISGISQIFLVAKFNRNLTCESIQRMKNSNQHVQTVCSHSRKLCQGSSRLFVNMCCYTNKAADKDLFLSNYLARLVKINNFVYIMLKVVMDRSTVSLLKTKGVLAQSVI